MLEMLPYSSVGGEGRGTWEVETKEASGTAVSKVVGTSAAIWDVTKSSSILTLFLKREEKSPSKHVRSPLEGKNFGEGGKRGAGRRGMVNHIKGEMVMGSVRAGIKVRMNEEVWERIAYVGVSVGVFAYEGGNVEENCV